MLSERPACFESRGDLLRGTLHVPDNNVYSAGIIMLNGWGGYRIGPHRLYVKAGRTFCAQGFHVLRFDFRGTGDSDGILPSQTEEHVATFLEDTQAAVQFLRSTCPIKYWYLLGLCTGGESAAIYATQIGDLHGLVIWSAASHFGILRAAEPSRRIVRYAKTYFRKLTLSSTWKRFLRGDLHLRGVLRTLFIDTRGTRGPSTSQGQTVRAKRGFLRCPTLLVYGTADTYAKTATTFFEEHLKAHAVPYQLHLLPGADPAFSSVRFTDQLLTITADWLAAQPDLLLGNNPAR